MQMSPENVLTAALTFPQRSNKLTKETANKLTNRPMTNAKIVPKHPAYQSQRDLPF